MRGGLGLRVDGHGAETESAGQVGFHRPEGGGLVERGRRGGPFRPKERGHPFNVPGDLGPVSGEFRMGRGPRHDLADPHRFPTVPILSEPRFHGRLPGGRDVEDDLLRSADSPAFRRAQHGPKVLLDPAQERFPDLRLGRFRELLGGRERKRRDEVTLAPGAEVLGEERRDRPQESGPRPTDPVRGGPSHASARVVAAHERRDLNVHNLGGAS